MAVGGCGFRLVASGRSLVGVARESPATFGLALPGCASRPTAGCGLAQQSVTPACAVLEVGMPTVVFPIGRTDKDYDMIIGVDPRKLSHTATVVDPLTNIAALHGDAREVTAEDDATMFALLEEHRANVAGQRVRAVNQLHALMRDLIPGGARTALTARVAAAALRRVRPITPADQTRKDIARDLVRDIRGIDQRLTAIAERVTSALAERGSSLIEVDGIGPVLGVRLIGRTGPAARFRSSDAFASYAGVALVEFSSGERITHRLSRSGDRQLNSALHLVAVTQVTCAGARAGSSTTARSTKARHATKPCDA